MKTSSLCRTSFRRKLAKRTAVACLGLSAPLLLAAAPPASHPISKHLGVWRVSETSIGDEKPPESKAGDLKPNESKPFDLKPSDLKPIEAKPSEPKRIDVKSADSAPSADPDKSSRSSEGLIISKPDPVNVGASINVIPLGEEQLIDLTTALRLAETANPQIAISRQGIQTAMAKQLGAKALALPHLRAGMNFHLHNNVLQTSFGLLRHVNSRSFYFGGGAATLAAETLALPAIQIDTHLGEALYAPLAARQHVNASHFESRATINEVFLEVSTQYLELMAAEAELKAIQQSEAELGEIVRIVDATAKVGRGRESDARRARTEALLTRLEEERAQEKVAIAAADLSRILHLDPSTRLHTPGGAIATVDLIDPNEALPSLLEIAQRARPELAARLSEIQRHDYEYRQAKTKPLFPNVQVRFSGGGFSGTTNRTDLVSVSPNYGPVQGRIDVDFIMYWQLDNLGLGNLASTRQKRSEREIATLDWHHEQAKIRDEVVTAYGRMEQTLEAMSIAERRLGNAERGLKEDVQRTQGGVGLTVEVLDSMKLLIQARNAMITATADYDIAQFELYVAIGQTPEATRVAEPSLENVEPQMPAPGEAPAPAPKENP